MLKTEKTHGSVQLSKAKTSQLLVSNNNRLWISLDTCSDRTNSYSRENRKQTNRKKKSLMHRNEIHFGKTLQQELKTFQ